MCDCFLLWMLEEGDVAEDEEEEEEVKGFNRKEKWFYSPLLFCDG